jgi:acyl-CoA synthetase (AMP-forming)/AMP-acid ligase II
MSGEGTAIELFTSGTTGEPKAALLRHRHLVSYVLGSVEFMGAHEDEAALVSVPPYHVAGIAAILSNVYAGRRVVQLPTFDAGDWVALVRAESVTSAMVVPTMLTRIVEVLDAEGPDGPGLPTLRSLSYGGGRMPSPTILRALELLPTTAFVNAYGLTETSSTVALLGPTSTGRPRRAMIRWSGHASARQGDHCPPSRSRSGTTSETRWQWASPARSGSGESRSQASTGGRLHASPPTAGSPPTTAAGWTPTGSST